MDYSKVGLKCGLEIHQQLDTEKLFCSCSSFLRKDNPDFFITRKLHKVAGETGEVDAAVEYESSLDKEFVYQGYNDTTCLVEIDEQPPHEINQKALNEAIKIALLLNCDFYAVTQIMRKIVIDGSNTAGFQRTLLLAHSGFIETSFGRVPIDSVALEEDSARTIEKNKSQAVYRLDRLGIPLVEITTAPAMNSPDQVKEAALKIGEILRACKVKRGIGTIRQDVNISIKGHEKVEIKGFQEPTMFVKTIELEAERQARDIKSGKIKGEVRNALPDGKTEFLRPLPGKFRMYPETDLPLLKIGRDRLNSVKKILPKTKAEMKNELKKDGLSDELVELVLDGNFDEFHILMKVYDRDASLVAKMVTLWRNELATKKKVSLGEVKEILNESVLEKILEKIKEKNLDKSDVREVMEKIFSGIKFEDAILIEKISHDELEEEISKIIKSKPGMRENAYMGLVMQRFRGKLDAKKAMEIVARLVRNG